MTVLPFAAFFEPKVAELDKEPVFKNTSSYVVPPSNDKIPFNVP